MQKPADFHTRTVVRARVRTLRSRKPTQGAGAVLVPMKVILAYTAADGLFNAITDTIHKVPSPSTYSCSLCRYTFGVFGMLRRWRNYLAALPYEITFYHRREFRRAFPHVVADLPAIFFEREGALTLAVSSEEISACENLDELIEIVDERLSAPNSDTPYFTVN